MKTKLTNIVTSIVLCAAFTATAQRVSTYQTASAHETFGKMERADKLIGRDVLDPQNQKLGVVRDLAVDLKNGRLAAVIVGTGGTLGVGETYAAVPPQEFTCDAQQNAVRLSEDQAKFNSAPKFNLTAWEDSVSQPKLIQMYQAYNVQPYFATTEPNQPMGAPVLGRVERADNIIGSTVNNMQSERLGKVNDLLVELRSGRVDEVIVASGGFLGIGDELSGVPPQAFQRHDGDNRLLLDTTKDKLASAPHFKSSEWPALDNQEQVVAVYNAYNVQPWFSANASGIQNSSESDMAITRQIRQELSTASGLSTDARNITITTTNGRVTLSGTVPTQTEKDKIVAIARKVAKGNVDDRLSVKSIAATSSL